MLGNADLFLLNPNGIIFGSDAQLDLNGSFIATTADSVLFDNAFAFSASNRQAVPLLTLNVPVGLQYGSNPGRIVNQSVSGSNVFAFAGLQVQPEQTIALLGGDVALEAGGSLTTQGGRIEIGSVAGNSVISLTSTNPGWTVSYDGVENFQDINLDQDALAIDQGGGGVQLQGRRINLSGGAQVYALNVGAEAGETLTVKASESVELNGISSTGLFATGFFTETQGTGIAGDIEIDTQQLSIQDGAQIASYDPLATSEAGSGNVRLNTSDLVEVVGADSSGFGPSLIATQGFVGNGGSLTVITRRLVLQDGGRLSTSTFGAGKGGRVEVNASDSVELIGTDVSNTFRSGLFSRSEPSASDTAGAGEVVINTNNLIVQDGAEASTATLGEGAGGSLIVNAIDSVTISGISDNGKLNSRLVSTTDGTGNAGNLLVNTSKLVVQDGGQLLAATFSSGDGGSIEIDTSEFVEVRGSAGNFFSELNAGSLQSAETGVVATGNSGDLEIATGRLTILDGAKVTLGSAGSGSAGSLVVTASDVEIIGEGSLDGESSPSRLSARSIGTGTAGDLNITADQVTIQDGAEASVSSPQGQAGNLTITANTLTLNRGTLLAETRISGADSRANITLQDLNLFLLSNESLISATAFEDANGGNVAIDSTLIVALPPQGSKGSDIIANARRGNGGRVSIATQGLFDIQFRPNRTPDNDITVSSEFGIAGEFILTQPDVDPSRGLTALPTDLANATELIDRSCAPGGTARTSSFTVTGRGGFPRNPIEPLEQESLLEDLGRPVAVESATADSEEQGEKQATDLESNSQPSAIVEAQGWVRNADGQITLVALAPAVTPKHLWLTTPSCQNVQATIDLLHKS